MTVESSADTVEMLADWDLAKFDCFEVPCVFDDEFVDELEASGTQPRMGCAGRKVSAKKAELRDGANKIRVVNTGDTVSEIALQDGETVGPFTVRVIEPDGTGFVQLRLEG